MWSVRWSWLFQEKNKYTYRVFLQNRLSMIKKKKMKLDIYMKWRLVIAIRIERIRYCLYNINQTILANNYYKKRCIYPKNINCIKIYYLWMFLQFRYKLFKQFNTPIWYTISPWSKAILLKLSWNSRHCTIRIVFTVHESHQHHLIQRKTNQYDRFTGRNRICIQCRTLQMATRRRVARNFSRYASIFPSAWPFQGRAAFFRDSHALNARFVST